MKSAKFSLPLLLLCAATAQAASPAPAAKTNESAPAKASPEAAPAANSTASDGKDPSFAFVNLDGIFKQLPQVKSAEAKITEDKKAAEKEWQSRMADFQKRQGEFEAMKRRLATLKPNDPARSQVVADGERKAEELNKKQAENIQWRQQREIELQQKATSTASSIMADIRGAVNRLTQNVNLVLDFSGLSQSGVPFVVLHPAEADLTDRIVKALQGKDSPSVSSARGVRVGTIDLNGVFSQLAKTKEAEEKIGAWRAGVQQENARLTKNYDDEKAKIEKLSGADLEAQQNKVKKLEEELNAFRAKKETELGEQMTRYRQPIVMEMAKALEKVTTDRAAFVFDATGLSTASIPFLIWSKDLPDFSGELVTALNGDGKATPGTTMGIPSNELRFGVVDVERAYKTSPEGKQAEKEIDEAGQRVMRELPTASPQERQRKQQDMQILVRNKREPALKKVIAAIGEMATARKFNVILDSSAKSVNLTPALLSAQDLPDLTADLIAKMAAPAQ